MKSILDPKFRYTNAVNTDIRKTFNRIRAGQPHNAEVLRLAPKESYHQHITWLGRVSVIDLQIAANNPRATPSTKPTTAWILVFYGWAIFACGMVCGGVLAALLRP